MFSAKKVKQSNACKVLVKICPNPRECTVVQSRKPAPSFSFCCTKDFSPSLKPLVHGFFQLIRLSSPYPTMRKLLRRWLAKSDEVKTRTDSKNHG